MSEKTTKREWPMYAIYERDAFINHLEKRALEGWMFKGYKAPFILFEAIEPTTIYFAGTYCQDASAYAPEETEGQAKLQEISESTGWTYVASYDKLQVYCTDKDEIEPFETDPLTSLKSLKKASEFSVVSNGLMALLYLLLIPFYIIMISKVGFDAFNLIVLYVIIYVTIIFAFRFISFSIWFNKAKHYATEQNDFLPQKDYRQYRVISSLFLIFSYCILTAIFAKELIGVLISTLVGLVVILWFTFELVNLLKRKNVSKTRNIIITTVFLLLGIAALLGILLATFC